MVKRIILGRQSDGSYGLRCSQPGYDAYSNPVDSSRLIFDSSWPHLAPIILSGSAIAITNGATVTVSFPTQPSIPLVLYMLRQNTISGWQTPGAFPAYRAGAVVLLCGAYIDHLKIINNTSSQLDICYAVFGVTTQ